MKIKKLLALTGVGMSLAAGLAFVPSAANAGTMSTQGAIVCHTVATKHNPPASCWLTPGNTACQPYWTYKKVCD